VIGPHLPIPVTISEFFVAYAGGLNKRRRTLPSLSAGALPLRTTKVPCLMRTGEDDCPERIQCGYISALAYAAEDTPAPLGVRWRMDGHVNEVSQQDRSGHPRHDGDGQADTPDITPDPRPGAEPPVEEVSLKIHYLLGEAPPAVLSCHARRSRPTGPVRREAAGRAPAARSAPATEPARWAAGGRQSLPWPGSPTGPISPGWGAVSGSPRPPPTGTWTKPSRCSPRGRRARARRWSRRQSRGCRT